MSTKDFVMAGPMGPIGEQEALILRVNRNCPWNRCLFCPVYKDRRFSGRSVTEIKVIQRFRKGVTVFGRHPLSGSVRWGLMGLALLFAFWAHPASGDRGRGSARPGTGLAPMAYTIQIGAFSKLRNAERATAVLQDQGLDAYFFVHKTGLYKVRFGDFPSRTEARRRAEALRAAGIIDRYYLVGPEDYATTRQRVCGTPCLREEITKTAQRFLGVPYRFGSSSPKKGFDCSGFVMTVYRLNGLRLPRASADQWRAGRPVRIRQLSKGDLVFFATSGQGRISHVGIYMGKNRFIHAPSRGKKIRFGSLSNDYFKRRFMGARTYL